MAIVEGLMVWLLLTAGVCMNLYDVCGSDMVEGCDVYNETYIMNDPNVISFNTSSIDGLSNFLEYSQIDENEYDFDNYHCVNFSNDLIKELNLYGFNSSATHLRVGQEFDHCIVSVKVNDKIIFIEPQEDLILRFDELQEYYNYDEITIFDLIGYHTVFLFDGYISDDLKNMFDVNYSDAVGGLQYTYNGINAFVCSDTAKDNHVSSNFSILYGCMNLYEHIEYEVYEPEPVYTIKEYVAELNTSINRSERVDVWTCYDYSVDFAKNNLNFEVVTVSRSPEFEGISHMTNYQFYDDETMIIYDGLLDKLYFIHDLQWDVEDYDYYYFWIDETPTRECVDMIDNRDVIM